MAFKEKFSEYWHDLYYRLVPQEGVDFAMKCKDVATKIDLGEVPTDIVGRLRFRLHIGLCKACGHYLNSSFALRNAIRAMIKHEENSIDVETLNRKLLNSYSKPWKN